MVPDVTKVALHDLTSTNPHRPTRDNCPQVRTPVDRLRACRRPAAQLAAQA
nr:hypothetical protein [Kibdelosporangium sp. MJ126-NF4]CTQ89867.1 hypothetical protein [Kibdelosporangium sp. MJ126-NF4]